MKNRIYLYAIFSIFFSLFFLPKADSAEPLAADPAAAGTYLTENASQGSPFIFNLTPEGGVLAKAGSVFTESGYYENVTLPYLIEQPEPIHYPRWAVRQGWQGRFDIALEIREDGSVGRTKVMKSTGYEILDKAAEKAVHNWKFQPAVENGKPVLTCIQIPIFFQLDQK